MARKPDAERHCSASGFVFRNERTAIMRVAVALVMWLVASVAQAQTYVRTQPVYDDGVIDSTSDSAVIEISADRLGSFGTVKIQTADSYTGTWEVQCAVGYDSPYDEDNELTLKLVDSSSTVYEVSDTVGIWDVLNAQGCRKIRVMPTAGFSGTDSHFYAFATQVPAGSGESGNSSTLTAIQSALEGTLTVEIDPATLSEPAVHGNTYPTAPDGIPGMIGSVDQDGSAFPDTVTEGQYQRPVGSLYGIQYTMPVSEDGSKSPLSTTEAGSAPYWVRPKSLTPFKSIDLDESEEQVTASANEVCTVWVTNTSTGTRWLKFYNATAANVTVGTTVPDITIGIPGNSSDDVAGALGLTNGCLAFSTALSVAATTGVADNDTGAPGANDVVVMIGYR